MLRVDKKLCIKPLKNLNGFQSYTDSNHNDDTLNSATIW